MTLARLLTQLQQLLLEHPEAAEFNVVIESYGDAYQQKLDTIHLDHATLLLEARN